MSRSAAMFAALGTIFVAALSAGVGCEAGASHRAAPPPAARPSIEPTSRPTTAPTTPLATLFHTPGGYCALCAAQKQAQVDPETSRAIAPPASGSAPDDGDLLRDLPR